MEAGPNDQEATYSRTQLPLNFWAEIQDDPQQVQADQESADWSFQQEKQDPFQSMPSSWKSTDRPSLLRPNHSHHSMTIRNNKNERAPRLNQPHTRKHNSTLGWQSPTP
jgi:hypothetical protein